MASFSVSIVIPVWNEWTHTKACLENLRPTLGVNDEVIVVDNGSEDHTPKGLRQYPWAKVITNETNQGFAVACNQGAAIASREVVVFLNNDTITPSRWLDALVKPFSDESVYATGPRSNFVSGPQVVTDVSYAIGDNAALRRFARRWRDEHRDQYSDVARLVGFCLAVRTTALRSVGGFDESFETGGCEDDDLCLRLIAAGGRLVICHESFVHHHGHATFDANGLDWFAIQQDNMDRFRTKHGQDSIAVPANTSSLLLSACMIVKDEAEILSQCLSSLNGVVDEVVIYDTGSSDNTVELAKAAGAKVIEGHWDDDFSRARNEALRHCKGDWVLQIDADELFEGQAEVIRSLLYSSPATSFVVDILNLSPDERFNISHRTCRLFRRTAHHWVGRLHEQVVPKSADYQRRNEILPGARLVHSGYLPEALIGKGKVERNLRMAEAELEQADGRDNADKLANLGRSYMIAERYPEALETFRQASNIPTSLASVRRTIFRSACQTALSMEQPDEVLVWISRLADVSTAQGVLRYFRGVSYTQLGRHLEALSELEDLSDVDDDDGVVFPLGPVTMSRAYSYAALGRWAEAASEIRSFISNDHLPVAIFNVGVQTWAQSGADMSELVAALDDTELGQAAAQLVQIPAPFAQQALEAIWASAQNNATVLAAALRMAPTFEVKAALEWSSRLRQANLAQHCPLLAIGSASERSGVDRVSALALAHSAFGEDVTEALAQAAGECDTAEFKDLLVRLNEIAPSLLQTFIIGAATNGERSFELAQMLADFGAIDEGAAVLIHGLSIPGSTELVNSAIQWLNQVGRPELAAQVSNA